MADHFGSPLETPGNSPHLKVPNLLVGELVGHVQQLPHVVVPLLARLPGTGDSSAAVLLSLLLLMVVVGVAVLSRCLHADKVALVAQQKGLH